MNVNKVDFTVLPDVVTEVYDHLPQIEIELHRLVNFPNSPELIDSVFRRMHTIKGDFGYCRATPIMDFVHHLESVLQAIREQRYLCSALVAEAILQSLTQVSDMMQTLVETEQFDDISRHALVELLEQLSKSQSQEAADQYSRHVLLTIHSGELGPPMEAPAPWPVASAENIARAINMGEHLAAALAQRHPLWHNRVAAQRKLIFALNRQYLHPANPDVLNIALIWHDVGLLASQDTLLQTDPNIKSPDWDDYAAHPERAATWLLEIAPDCTEAAQIIRQHHHWLNGAGIRSPNYKPPLHPGSFMLGCADLWFDRTAGLSGEAFRRGVLRAVFDVNARLEEQFDAALINAFTAIAKDMTET